MTLLNTDYLLAAVAVVALVFVVLFAVNTSRAREWNPVSRTGRSSTAAVVFPYCQTTAGETPTWEGLVAAGQVITKNKSRIKVDRLAACPSGSWVALPQFNRQFTGDVLEVVLPPLIPGASVHFLAKNARYFTAFENETMAIIRFDVAASTPLSADGLVDAVGNVLG